MLLFVILRCARQRASKDGTCRAVHPSRLTCGQHLRITENDGNSFGVSIRYLVMPGMSICPSMFRIIAMLLQHAQPPAACGVDCGAGVALGAGVDICA